VDAATAIEVQAGVKLELTHALGTLNFDLSPEFLTCTSSMTGWHTTAWWWKESGVSVIEAARVAGSKVAGNNPITARTNTKIILDGR
jgi:hypothetical protein